MGDFLAILSEEMPRKIPKIYALFVQIFAHISDSSLLASDFMASSSSFVAGMNRVVDGSSSVRLEDFPPLGQKLSPIPSGFSGLGGVPPARVPDLGGSSAAAPKAAAAPRASDGSAAPSSVAAPRASDLGDSSSVVKDSPLGGWSSLFASAEAKLQFVAPIAKDGKKSVAILKSIFDQGISLWDDCLLGQLFGPPPKITVIQSFAEKLWGKNDRVDVIPLEGEGFLFKFNNSATKTWVLEEGSWFIASRPLLLRKWQPGLTLKKLSLQKFPIWVVLRGVPLELLTPDGLSCIASFIGFPLS